MNSGTLLGPAIVAARKAKPPVPWKMLAKQYRLSVSRLEKIWQETTGRTLVQCPACGHRHNPKRSRVKNP